MSLTIFEYPVLSEIATGDPVGTPRMVSVDEVMAFWCAHAPQGRARAVFEMTDGNALAHAVASSHWGDDAPTSECIGQRKSSGARTS